VCVRVCECVSVIVYVCVLIREHVNLSMAVNTIDGLSLQNPTI
jgi:hypothetical protein